MFVEGDPTTHVFRVETGAIALYKVLPDGRRQIVGFAYPGDLIGLGAGGEHVMNAQAIKPTRLRSLPLATLTLSATKDPTLGFKLYEALARELAATRDLMLTTGQRSATERVASFLLAFSRRSQRNGQDPSAFELPIVTFRIGTVGRNGLGPHVAADHHQNHLPFRRRAPRCVGPEFARHDDGQAATRELVDHSEHAKASPVLDAVLHEVVRPDVIGPLRSSC